MEQLNQYTKEIKIYEIENEKPQENEISNYIKNEPKQEKYNMGTKVSIFNKCFNFRI